MLPWWVYSLGMAWRICSVALLCTFMKHSFFASLLSFSSATNNHFQGKNRGSKVLGFEVGFLHGLQTTINYMRSSKIRERRSFAILNPRSGRTCCTQPLSSTLSRPLRVRTIRFRITDLLGWEAQYPCIVYQAIDVRFNLSTYSSKDQEHTFVYIKLVPPLVKECRCVFGKELIYTYYTFG